MPRRDETPKEAPGRARFPLIDGTRAVGALLVFITHITVLTGASTYAIYGLISPQVGEIGLAMLFALSAFLLSRPWTAERHGGRAGPTVPGYARNRLLRLVPAYWAALTVQLLVPGGFPGFTDPGVPQFALVQIYSDSWAFDGLKHSWTLCTEASFYVVLVAYAGLAARRFAGDPRWELWALAVFAVVGPITHFVIFTVGSHYLIALQWLLGYMDYVAIGLALAVVSVRVAGGQPLPRWLDFLVRRPSLTWAGAVVLFVGGILLLQPSTDLAYPPTDPAWKWTIRHLLIGATCGLLLLPATLGDDLGGVPRRFLHLAPMRWLGLRSYGFYLWHLPVLFWVKERGWNGLGPAPLVTYGVISLALTMVLAFVSHTFVEEPFDRLKSRRRRTASAPLSPLERSAPRAVGR